MWTAFSRARSAAAASSAAPRRRALASNARSEPNASRARQRGRVCVSAGIRAWRARRCPSWRAPARARRSALRGLARAPRAALEQQRIADPEDALGGDRRLVGAERRCARPRSAASRPAARRAPSAPSSTSSSKRAARVKPGSARRSSNRSKRRCGVQLGSPVKAAACEPAWREPAAVGVERLRCRAGIVGGARAERYAGEVGERAAILRERLPDPGERLGTLQRAQISDQEAVQVACSMSTASSACTSE